MASPRQDITMVNDISLILRRYNVPPTLRNYICVLLDLLEMDESLGKYIVSTTTFSEPYVVRIVWKIHGRTLSLTFKHQGMFEYCCAMDGTQEINGQVYVGSCVTTLRELAHWLAEASGLLHD